MYCILQAPIPCFKPVRFGTGKRWVGFYVGTLPRPVVLYSVTVSLLIFPILAASHSLFLCPCAFQPSALTALCAFLPLVSVPACMPFCMQGTVCPCPAGTYLCSLPTPSQNPLLAGALLAGSSAAISLFLSSRHSSVMCQQYSLTPILST